NKLGVHKRPSQISVWFGRRRAWGTIPPIKDVDAFEQSFKEWWSGMQPMWRIPRGKFWPLKRRNEEGERWASLMKGGPNGFVLVLISLVWWSK
ncbi:uncharacterized protein STEHIDRAFT_38735, partial [Stereum hirsutum FP-91666 SS1]|uniref:uncharacterized protein n=1 Tax=Stereum hirsutum (strain FP-91666) TaxID=721885 RepID=UPI000440C8A6